MKTLKSFLSLVLLSVLFFACHKEYSLESAITPAGTWQFNDSTKLYTGNIDTAFINTTGTSKEMTLMGKSTDGQQTFLLHIYATDSFTVGSYKTSLSQSDFQYFSQAKTIYQADQSIDEFIVTITAIGNNNVTGIFAGASEDSAGNNKPLTLGKFTSRIILSGNGTGGGGSNTSTGTLGVTGGVCTSATPAGIYTQGVSLTSANTVAIQVTVTTPGTYTISTNTVNGVSFSKSGTFTATGANSVILNGSGTPANSGSQNFTLTYGAATCNFPITFIAGTSPAVGTLGGSPGACTSITPAGIYTAAIPLTPANTIQAQVNVTTVGAYTISTNTVDGVSFTGTGTFTATGLQTVTLVATGTPTNSGVQNFTLTFGTSACNFSIPFTGAVVATDYFPTTAGSFWAYGNSKSPPDSILITATSKTQSINGAIYNVFTLEDIPRTSNVPDSLFYRKSGGVYYENFNTKNLFQFDNPGNPPNVEYIFLKENAAVNDTWQSPTITGMQGANTYSVYIKATLIERATTPTTSGIVTSSDVLKVKYEYFVSGGPIPTPIVVLTEMRWFAKNIGMIYNSFDDGTGTGPDIYKIGRYRIF